MNNLCLFLNARVEDSGALAWIGNKGLAPFRYLFDGKTIRIETRSEVEGRDADQLIEIHHVASFHKMGHRNYSKIDINLASSSTGMIKTILSIVFLIPGVILGVAFKGLAYCLFTDVKEKHALAKEHFTPVNREIGSVTQPIANEDELEGALKKERNATPKNQPTNALIIHGNGTLKINKEPGILWFNPMKLVLEGAQIVHDSCAADRLDDRMRYTGKWQLSPCRTIGASTSHHDTAFANSQSVNSVEEALQATAPWRSWAPLKRYHMVYCVPRPQVAASS